MKAIILSAETFLVNTKYEKPGLRIAGKIVSISTTETESTPRYGGGSNDDTPQFGYVNEQEWNDSSATFEVVELESRPELLGLYNKVSNALEDEVESASDFTYNHGYAPL